MGYIAQPLDGDGRATYAGLSVGNGFATAQLDDFTVIDSLTSLPTAAQMVTFGGLNSLSLVAGKVANTVVKTGAGRLCKVLVTTLGTNPLVIYDNASAASGTILGYIAASAVAGTVTDLQMSAAAGIYVAGNAANPAVTISWS